MAAGVTHWFDASMQVSQLGSSARASPSSTIGTAMGTWGSAASVRKVGRQGLAWRGAVGTALLVLVSAACSGGDSGSEVAVEAGPPVGALEPGESRVLTPPREGVRRPLTVVGADGVLQYGGVEVVDDASIVPRNDATFLDLATGEWIELPDAPFEHGLLHPAGVWTGSEFVVVGMPCGKAPADVDVAECGGPRLEAAALDSTSREWREIGKLDVAFDSSLPPEPTALGWTGEHGMFQVASAAGDFLRLAPATGETAIATGVDAEPERYCFVDDALYGVATTPSPDDVYDQVPGDVLQETPIRTWRFDAQAMRWSELEPRGKPPVDLVSERVECGDGASGELVYVPLGEADATSDAVTLPMLDGVLWFQPGTAAWEEIPAPGVNAFGQTRIASVAGNLVWWPETGDELRALDPDRQSWTSSAKPSPGPAATLQSTDGVGVAAVVDGEAASALALFRPAG